MSNKIHIPYYRVLNTIYVVIRDKTDKVWHISNKVFEVWDDTKIAKYVVNSVYKEGLLFAAVFPIDVPTGYYTIMIFLQSGDSPVVDNDIWIGSMSSYWDKDNSNLLAAATAGPVVTIERTPTAQVESPTVTSIGVQRGSSSRVSEE